MVFEAQMSNTGLLSPIPTPIIDTEFFILLLRAKIGNLSASAKFLQFTPIFTMIFNVIKAYVYDNILNEAFLNAFLGKSFYILASTD